MWDETFQVGNLRNQRVFHNRVSTDGVSVSVFFHVAKERLKREKAERVRVEKEDEEKEMLERQQGQENLQPVRERRIVAIDPGRVNLVTALDSQTGKIKTLTCRAYYEKGRINECKRKFNSWEDALGDINAAFSRTTMKSCCPDLRSAYRELIVRHYHRLWDARCEKKRARAHMAVYAGKQKVLDVFFAGLTGPGQAKPIIAYGAGIFPHTGKGE
ncbi:hypothetical protein VYU27_005360, partial [Nannochloropsis oceanica]